MPSAKRKAGHPSNGNMLNDGSNTLTYDAENRLLTSSGSLGSGSYSYDGNNLRVKKVSGSTTTVYIFSGSKVIAEYDNGAAPGSPSREYIYSGTALLAKIDSSGSKYYHQDHLSNRAVTGSSGNTVAQLGHFPYGESWYNASSDKLLFTTYERDAESGNDYAMARYDVNRLGRFSSPDPLPGSIDDPQSLNRYSYVRNMPVMEVDPTGMSIPCSATNLPDETDRQGSFRLASYFLSEAEPEPEPEPQGCTKALILDGGDISFSGGEGMGFPLYAGSGTSAERISGTWIPNPAYWDNEGCRFGDCPNIPQFIFASNLLLFGDNGSGPGGNTSGVHKAFSKTFNCNTNAAGAMKQLEADFSKFANFVGNFGPLGIDVNVAAVSFGSGPVTQGRSIPITDVNLIPNPMGYAPLVQTVNTSVTVQSVSATSFTFSTDPGHVLRPATISFSASDAGNNQINFAINVNGQFAGPGARVGYYAGGYDLENKIWNNLIKNIQALCNPKR